MVLAPVLGHELGVALVRARHAHEAARGRVLHAKDDRHGARSAERCMQRTIGTARARLWSGVRPRPSKVGRRKGRCGRGGRGSVERRGVASVVERPREGARRGGAHLVV